MKKYSEYYVSERVLQTLHYTECCHHYGSIISLSASAVFLCIYLICFSPKLCLAPVVRKQNRLLVQNTFAKVNGKVRYHSFRVIYTYLLHTVL